MISDYRSPITISDFDKLVDDLYYLGTGFTLKFNVILNKKDENGKKRNFHNEFLYNSGKYIDAPKLATMKRNFDYYLSIEDNNKTAKTYVMIGIQHIYRLQMIMDQVMMWFTSEKYRNLFAVKNDKLIRVERVEPLILDRLPMDSSIGFEPVVISYEDMEYEGIRMYIDSQYIDMNIDRFYAFAYLIKTMNMYQSAQLLINYNGRPEIGERLVDFSGNNSYGKDDRPIKHPRAKHSRNRFIPGTENKNGLDSL